MTVVLKKPSMLTRALTISAATVFIAACTSTSGGLSNDDGMPTMEEEIAIAEEAFATDLSLTTRSRLVAAGLHRVTPVVTNLGPATATGVTVVLTSVGATPLEPLPSGCQHDAGHVSCRVQPPSLDLGQSGHVTIDYQLDGFGSTAVISITSRSQFNGLGNDLDPFNNSDLVTFVSTAP